MIGDEHANAAQQDSPTPKNASEATSSDASQALGLEAARLAEAFSAWAGARSSATDSEDQMAGSGSDSEATGAEPAEDSAGSRGSAGMRGETTCDCAKNAGTDAICRVCPICRVAAYVQTVRPEVLERVGDVLAMVASSLQAMAAERSDERADERKAPGTANNSFDDADDAANGASESPEPSVTPIRVRGDEFPSQTGGAG